VAFLEFCRRAIVLRCRSSGECEGHGKRSDDVQSGIVQPRNAQLVAAMSSSSSSSVQKVQLPCARSNASLDDKSSTLAPPSHGEEGGQSGGDCCCVSLCTRNCTLTIDTSFCNTPPLLPRVHLCVCLLPGLFTENCRPDILGSKSKDWTHSMQGTIPHRGFYVINLHDLIGSSSVVPAD
jgi:hypothetical protein